jgi:hypothetical protein
MDKVLKIEELEKELEQVEMDLFILDMKDRWTSEDYQMSYRYDKRIMELKKQIQELKEGQ